MGKLVYYIAHDVQIEANIVIVHPKGSPHHNLTVKGASNSDIFTPTGEMCEAVLRRTVVRSMRRRCISDGVVTDFRVLQGLHQVWRL